MVLKNGSEKRLRKSDSENSLEILCPLIVVDQVVLESV